MSKKAIKAPEKRMMRIEMEYPLLKKVKQAALDEDCNVSDLVRCVLKVYANLPRNQRNLVKKDCKDGLTPAGELIPVETEPENL